MEKVKEMTLIKKLLSLAENNTDKHEVESAMLKVQELLVKHDLSMEEISGHEVDANANKDLVDKNITEYGRTVWWLKVLSHTIGENFRCHPYTSSRSGKSAIYMIGLEDDVDIANMVFNFAKERIESCAKQFIIDLVDNHNESVRPHQYITPRQCNPEKNDYIKGFLRGLKAKFKEQVDKNNWGLVLTKDQLIVNYVNDMNFRKGSSLKVNSSGNDYAYNKGFKEGKSFEYSGNFIK